MRGAEPELHTILPPDSSLRALAALSRVDRRLTPNGPNTAQGAATPLRESLARARECLPPPWRSLLDRVLADPDLQGPHAPTPPAAIALILSHTRWGTPIDPSHQPAAPPPSAALEAEEEGEDSPGFLTLSSPAFTVKAVTHHLLYPSRVAREGAWLACAVSAVTLGASTHPQPDPRPAAHALVQALPSRVRRVWKLPWENKWKELWYRLLQQGVRGAGGHGWALPRDAAACICGWHQAVGAPSPIRATQLREHVFWGCAGAQEVRRTLEANLPAEACLLPHHIWLLEPPACTPAVREEVWFAVALSSLHAMHQAWRYASCPEPSHAPDVSLVAAKATDALEAALKDFACCQGLSSALPAIGAPHPFLHHRPDGSVAVHLHRPPPA